MKFCFFVVDARGGLWNCKEGNDEDSNPELPKGVIRTLPNCLDTRLVIA